MSKDKTERTSGLAIAGFIIAILAILGSWVPILNNVSFFFAIISLIFGIIGLIAIRKGKRIGQGLAVATIILSVLTFVVVLAMRQQEQPASFIVKSHLGKSGWNDGTAWVLGITNAMYTFGGMDGVIHISEELVGPGRRVPQVMAATMVIGLLTTLPLFLALTFCVKDIDAVMNSPLPSLEITY